MKMQPKKNLRRFNNKRGISLVVAIALVLVLSLTTATFVSIAILQQKDTGITLSSRQAYVQTKSSLDFVEDYLSSGSANLNLPVGKKFYVFYYDDTGAINKKDDFSTATDAKKWIEENKNKYKIIGNAYFKVENTHKNDENGNPIYKLTAVGTDSTFSANDTQLSDLSTKFSLVISTPLVTDWKTTELTLKEPTLTSKTTDGASGGGKPSESNAFFMVGMQLCHSLRTSCITNPNSTYSTAEQYNPDGKGYLGGNNNATSFNAILQGNGNGNQNNVNINGKQYQNVSQFPVVYNYTVKYTTNDNRSAFYAYDTGFYYMGLCGEQRNYWGKEACYVQNNVAYATDLYCKYVVFNGDVYSKKGNEPEKNGALILNSYGNCKNNKVVIYASRDIHLYLYNENENYNANHNGIFLKKGYYCVPSGTNIMELTSAPEEVKNISNYLTADVDQKHIEAIVSNYETMYSAYDDLYKHCNSCKQGINILKKDFIYNTDDPSNNEYYKNSRIDTQTSNIINKHENIDIYCAPIKAPEKTGYYYMYANKSFNFMWNNINSMDIKDNVNMSILSDNIVMSIGVDKGEEIYASKIKNDSSTYYYSAHNGLNPSGYLVSVENKNATASNMLIAKDDTKLGGDKFTNAKFVLSPYWGNKVFTIKVMTDFIVQGPNINVTKEDKQATINGVKCSNAYVIKEGTYTIDMSEIDYGVTSTSNTKGIDLFGPSGVEYFTGKSTVSATGSSSSSNLTGTEDKNGKKDSTTESVNWTISGGFNKSVSDADADETGKHEHIKFEILKNDTIPSIKYKTIILDVNFGGYNVNVDGNTTLSAKLLRFEGNTVFKQTTSSASLVFDTAYGNGEVFTYKVGDGDVANTTLEGVFFQISSGSLTFELLTGEKYTLSQGYYLIKNTGGNASVNMFDKDIWTNLNIYTTKVAGKTVVSTEKKSWNQKYDKIITYKFEGGIS